MVQSLQQRIHVTGCTLVLKPNVTCLLLWVIRPIINNLAYSNIRFNYTSVIHEVPFVGIIQLTERHERSETPITLPLIELVLCVCKTQKRGRGKHSSYDLCSKCFKSTKIGRFAKLFNHTIIIYMEKISIMTTEILYIWSQIGITQSGTNMNH